MKCRPERVDRRRDDGTTLLEVVVAMSLMSIFLAIFTGAIVLITSNVNKVSAATVTADNINAAYLALDKEVRYASAISVPGQSSNGWWYVEFSTPDTSNTSHCTQIRLMRPTATSSYILQQQTWTMSALQVAGSRTGWSTVANEFSNGSVAAGSSTQPFTISTASASLFQQLTVTLVSTQNSPTAANTATSLTFTALNSTATSSTAICQQYGRSPTP